MAAPLWCWGSPCWPPVTGRPHVQKREITSNPLHRLWQKAHPNPSCFPISLSTLQRWMHGLGRRKDLRPPKLKPQKLENKWSGGILSNLISLGKVSWLQSGALLKLLPPFSASGKVQGTLSGNGFEKKNQSEYSEVHCNITYTAEKYTPKVFFPWCFSI